MARRNRPKPMPADFTPHDGSGMPTDGRVTIYTAMGSKTTMDALEIDQFAESPWIWRYDTPSGMEIIGWKPA